MNALTLSIAVAVTAMVAMAAVAGPTYAGRLDRGAMSFQRLEGVRWHFDGELGRRIRANLEQWILRAPEANPGMLDMFRRRDRKHPYPDHTPWAGEFAGKYLISAVQAYRIAPSPRLRRHLQSFVDDLIATQADDGYLGPWPKGRQLMGDCDLWGHYHCMQGLLLWADEVGDQQALQSVLRAAECICRLYVDQGRRPIEAGNPCFNLSVLHIMAELYRRTGNERYRTLIGRIEEDLPRDGDWLRKGVEGVPYWRLPGSGPRWEALHILQGFVTMWQATGDEKYRTAVLNHWCSIRDLDRHPSGAFSTNEQASGTIFANGSIETCCSVAWMALTADVLKLTGDPTVADELELTLWNQALAAQHPSGSWCTYDTPLNGVRAPSYHQISFQYRPGSPELNCCSVNSPRTLGMLPDWALLREGGAVVVNFYGPSAAEVPLPGGGRFTIRQRTAYPVEGRVVLELDAGGADVTLKLRIPGWSHANRVLLNGRAYDTPLRAGSYLTLRRRWMRGDRVELHFDMSPRLTMGEGPDRGGMVSIQRGPLLLAFDEGLNALDCGDLAPIDVRRVHLRAVGKAEREKVLNGLPFPPMGLWATKTDAGREVYLCDFASAGARGTAYAAWLRASHAAPPPVRLILPERDAVGRPGSILFVWSPTGSPADRYHLLVARDPAFQNIAASAAELRDCRTAIGQGLEEPGTYFWKVVSVNEAGTTENRDGPARFTVQRDAPHGLLTLRPDGCLVEAPLMGAPEPTCGILTLASSVEPANGPRDEPGGAVHFSGRGSGLRYRLAFFPADSYSVTVWVRPSAEQVGLGQIVSAWCRGMDDPLRVSVENGEISARLEAGSAFRTAGTKVEPGRWVHVAAVKDGGSLRLYVDGRQVAACNVPERIHTMATEIGVGFNPFFSGGEYFCGDLSRFSFYARALSDQEIQRAASGG